MRLRRAFLGDRRLVGRSVVWKQGRFLVQSRAAQRGVTGCGFAFCGFL
jgi:hypothetical protein